MLKFNSLSILLLFPIVSYSAPDVDDFLKRQKTYEVVVDHTYTKSIFHLPYKCKEKAFNHLCSFYTNYYSSDFDNRFTEYITDKLDVNDENVEIYFSSDATQEIYLNFANIKPIKIFSTYASVTQNFHGETVSFTQVFNSNSENFHIVDFNDLFEKPQYAATICSNIIYDTFKKYGSMNLYKLTAMYEVQPRNYMLLPDGLMFYISKGLVAPDEVDSRVFISIDKLSLANPLEKYFPFLNKKNTLPPPSPPTPLNSEPGNINVNDDSAESKARNSKKKAQI